MIDKLADIEKKFLALEARLSDPGIHADPKVFRETAREHASLRDIVDAYRDYRKVLGDLEGARELAAAGDAEMAALAREEVKELQARAEALEEDIRVLLLPKDPNDERDVFLEIRAGAGGDEASLFVADLFRLYSRYAEARRWRLEVVEMSHSEAGGYKEVIAMIRGDRVYSRLKYESGVHRVQRVPATEAQGRIHTSTVTVAVMPEAEEVEVQINPNDLRIDVFRSGGPGGQSVNTTDSAVRVTHLPTGLVVQCQNEKSQHKNKAAAIAVLKARLYERERAEQDAARSAQRRSQVGTGERSERIRTYNFPQGRVTDHRIGLTLHQLDRVMEGEIDDLLNALNNHFQAEALKEGTAAAAAG